MQILTDYAKARELTMNREEVLKVCEEVIKAMEDGLPNEAHTIEAYEYVLEESKKLLREQVITLQKSFI